MSRKIKIKLANEQNLEETLRKNLLKGRQNTDSDVECSTYADTEPVDEHGPEDVFVENVGAANASPKKVTVLPEIDIHESDEVSIAKIQAAIKKDITPTEVINHENDSILGPTIENEFRKPEVIQMRIDANDINKKDDIKACKNFLTGFHDSVSKLKETTVIETLKELSPDQVAHIEDLAKKILNFNQRIQKVENTKEDAKTARILINQEDNKTNDVIETRTNINKENKEDIKKSCIKAKNILSDKSFDNTYTKYEKHYGDVSTGEFLMDIPKENLESVDKYENVNHPEHYNNYDVEAIEMMERIWGPEETAIFCKLNAFKYRMRMGTKPTSPVEEDIKKEKWYIKKYHELLNKLKIK